MFINNDLTTKYRIFYLKALRCLNHCCLKNKSSEKHKDFNFKPMPMPILFGIPVRPPMFQSRLYAPFISKFKWKTFTTQITRFEPQTQFPHNQVQFSNNLRVRYLFCENIPKIRKTRVLQNLRFYTYSFTKNNIMLTSL